MFNGLPTWACLLIYFVFAAGIVFFSKKLADYVDALDKKTKISGAFIGAVLLAAVTSLPELFTSISATLLVEDGAGRCSDGMDVGVGIRKIVLVLDGAAFKQIAVPVGL